MGIGEKIKKARERAGYTKKPQQTSLAYLIPRITTMRQAQESLDQKC